MEQVLYAVRDFCVEEITWSLFKGGSTGDDFNQLTSDDGLSGTIESQLQLLNHLSYNT